MPSMTPQNLRYRCIMLANSSVAKITYQMRKNEFPCIFNYGIFYCI